MESVDNILRTLICQATQKTNYACSDKSKTQCKEKGTCAYCIAMAEQLIQHGVTIEEHKWIDVNDHLPTSDGRFMVTIKNKRKAHVEMRNFHAIPQQWEGGSLDDNVIAWQARPAAFTSSANKELS